MSRIKSLGDNIMYEGLIKDYGDKVTISDQPDITISTYVKGAKLDYEDPVPTSQNLDINQGRSYSFNIPKVDEKQSMIGFVDKWSDDAAKRLKINVETAIYAAIYGDADSNNAGATAGAISGDINLGVTGTPVALTTDSIITYILNMGVVLDEQNVPDEDRWLLLPSWACSRLKDSDLKDASLTGDGKSTLRTSRVGMIDRFNIYQTNLLYVSGTETNIMAGHISALTFAAQLTENEIIVNPDDFGRRARGLLVYGYKVVKDTALVHGVVDKS